MLAKEIYRREQGSLPAFDEDPVGLHLDVLPDNGLGDAGEGTAPTVRWLGSTAMLKACARTGDVAGSFESFGD
jgi:hypothetical protein